MPEEKALWIGQPNPSKLFTRADYFLVPMFIAGGAFAIWFVIKMFILNIIFIVFVVLYFTMIIYICVGRFFVKEYVNKRTVYAVTNRRVIRLTLGSSGQRKKGMSAELKSIAEDSLVLRCGGCGTIYFDKVPLYSKLFLNTGMEYLPGYQLYNGLVFFDVDNADEVFKIYKNARNEAKGET
jgi:hypothetical protein